MKLRAFTDEGLQAVHSLLDDLKADRDGADIAGLLDDNGLTLEIGLELGRVPKSFENRFDLALWLNRQLDDHPLLESVGTVGMWTWLTVLLLDVLAPERADGTRKIGQRSLYVLEPDNWQRYYRHLLAGPYRVMRAHWDELHVTRALLAGKPNVPGEVYEQIASRQEVVTSSALVRLTRHLYWDESTKVLKRGAGGKGAGASRRLATVLLQLDLTWDFVEMTDEALVKLLPHKEFARFVRS